MRNRILAVIKVAVSLGLLVWLMTHVDAGHLLRRAAEMNIAWLAVSVVVGFGTMSLCAFRWWRINSFVRIRLPLWFCQLAYVEAITISLLLPGSTAGDVVRAVRVGRSSGNYAGAISATIFDRIGNLGAIILLGLIIYPFVIQPGDVKNFGIVVAAAIAIGLLGLIALFSVPFTARVRQIRWLRGSLRLIIIFRRAFGSWQKAGEITVLSIGGLLGTASMLYFAALSAGVEDAQFIELAGAAVLGVIVSAIPVTIAGLGLREGAVIWALRQFDYSQEDAYLAAFAFGFCIMAQALPGVVVWFSGTLDRKDVRATAASGPRDAK